MKKRSLIFDSGLAVVLGLLLMLNAGCSYAMGGIEGDGDVVKQERKVGSFSAIEVGGAFHVFLTQGDQEKVVVEADENLLDIITTEVNGKTLEISTRKEIRNAEKLNVHVTFKNLTELDVSGACNLEGENKFTLGDLDVDFSGAANVEMKFSAAEMDIDCSGASKVEFYGSAENVKLDLSGASHLEAIDFEVKVLDADVSGAAHGKMTVTEELSADVSGAASFKYKGEPKLNQMEVSGAASLKKY